MKIVKSTSVFYTNEIDKIKKVSDNVDLASSFYSVEAISTPSIAILDSKRFSVTAGSFTLSEIFSVGESVEILQNGFYEKNVISGKGETTGTTPNIITIYQVSKELDTTTVNSICKQLYKKVTLTAVPENEYYILPTNERLIVRDSFASLKVNYADFIVYYPDLKNYSEFEFETIIQVALMMIYADCSGYADFYNTIHFASLENLLFLKIMCIISNRFASQNTQIQEETPCRKYEKALEKFTIMLKLSNNSDNTPSGDAPQKFQSGSYSLWFIYLKN